MASRTVEEPMKKLAQRVLSIAILLSLPAAAADLALSAHDNKVYLDNGAVKVRANAAPDFVTVLDIGVSPPKVIATVEVPTSIVGPPFSVTMNREQTFALVTAATRIDPADPTKTVVDNKLSVIDLEAKPPRVIATLEAGAGASGVSINRAGTLALVANRNEGTVSVFTIAGKTLTPAGKVKLGDEKSGPCHVAFTPDGARAIVTRDGDHVLSMLAIEGSTVTHAKRDFGAGIRPYGVEVSPDGAYAVVNNVGRSNGDAETASLVDLRANPPRVVDHVVLGQTLEGISLSPDGRHAVVVGHNGSNKRKDDPFYSAQGRIYLLRVDGGKFTRLSEAPIGTWSQGSVFSRDGKTVYVQNTSEQEIQVLRIDGDRIVDTGQRLKTNGGAAAMRTAW
jgi:DNA-binding beta-propeller fold protein YncE